MANNTRSVLVVGLGRFGSSVATTLDTMGQDVLAVDKDGELVNRWSSQIPTVQADMTDVMALEQIYASDFDTAVVAIGDSVVDGDGLVAHREVGCVDHIDIVAEASTHGGEVVLLQVNTVCFAAKLKSHFQLLKN